MELLQPFEVFHASVSDLSVPERQFLELRKPLRYSSPASVTLEWLKYYPNGWLARTLFIESDPAAQLLDFGNCLRFFRLLFCRPAENGGQRQGQHQQPKRDSVHEVLLIIIRASRKEYPSSSRHLPGQPTRRILGPTALLNLTIS